MQLDLPTVLVICIVIELSLTLYLMVVWVNHRRNFPGIGLSVLGMVCMSLNFAGLLTQGKVHPLISIVAANAFVPIGYSFLVTALHRLQDKKPRRLPEAIFFLIILAVVIEQYIFGIIIPELRIRMMSMGFVIQFFSLYIVLFLFTTGSFRHPPGMLLIVSFLIQFIIFTVRIPYSLSPDLPQYFLHASGFQSVSALSWIIVSCAWPTGFTLLISRQLQEKDKLQNEEKTVLLRELHHRTKNNMQSIIAYLQLQQNFTESEEARGQLQMTENRIHAINLVHRKLMGSDNLSRINIKSYVEELADLVFESYLIDRDKIRFEPEIENFEVLIDMAIPIGLIINELFSNAFKYAFPDNRGVLALTLRQGNSNTIEMTVRDNGQGLPPGFDPDITGTLGIQTVCAIVKGQLRGAIEFDNRGGFFCRMVLDNNFYTERV
jgi:two-component sensor histidine kinase